MSNMGLKKYTKENELQFVETKVGDRYVLEEMLKNDYNFGGEQSGHVIMLDYNPTGDGILTSLMLLKSILDENKKVSEVKRIINIYPQVLINAKVSSDKKVGTIISQKNLTPGTEIDPNDRTYKISFEVESEYIVLAVGETYEFKPILNNVTNPNFSFSTSNGGIVQIANRKFTGLKPGVCEITVSLRDYPKADSVVITVEVVENK